MEPKDLTLDFKQLRVLRQSLGITQVEAARRVGITRQRLWNYEEGIFPPSAEVLARLLRLYDADLSALEANPVLAPA